MSKSSKQQNASIVGGIIIATVGMAVTIATNNGLWICIGMVLVNIVLLIGAIANDKSKKHQQEADLKQ